MRPLRYSWRRRPMSTKFGGAGVSLAGAVLIIKVLPFWIWPVGIGLWLVWSGLGPVVIGALLVWIGWRILIA